MFNNNKVVDEEVGDGVKEKFLGILEIFILFKCK